MGALGASGATALAAALTILSAPRMATGQSQEAGSTLFSGYGELRGGVRVRRDPYEDQATLGEARLHLELKPLSHERITLQAAGDLLIDSLAADADVDLERGTGFVDLREAYALLVPVPFMDLKIGRQVLSWGTSTSLFVNDLFPKDWQAYLLGRHSELLKAPSDAVKMSIYARLFDLDLVYVPRFDPDRFVSGERISFFNPLTLKRSGQNMILPVDVPDDWFEDWEGHARLGRNFDGREVAFYAYRGSWKSPAGFDETTGTLTFPALAVYGASYRQQLFSGIGQVELGYYDSLDDRDGGNGLANNSELRALGGYERAWPQLAKDLTVGLEYYVEWMQNYEAYRASLSAEFPPRDEVRHLVVLQASKLLLGQNLTASMFAYVSPTDEDVYFRAEANYKFEDELTVFAGANIYAGAKDHTFFGQLERNSNAYTAVRYGF